MVKVYEVYNIRRWLNRIWTALTNLSEKLLFWSVVWERIALTFLMWKTNRFYKFCWDKEMNWTRRTRRGRNKKFWHSKGFFLFLLRQLDWGWTKMSHFHFSKTKFFRWSTFVNIIFIFKKSFGIYMY